MKRFIYIFSLLFFATALSSVSGAGVKTPALTTGIEKAILQPYLDIVATSNGAVVHTSYPLNFAGGMYCEIYTVPKIHWCVDETFYSVGYRAKLSDAIEEIIAPPDPTGNFDMPLKYC